MVVDSILISLVVYFGLAAVLIAFGVPRQGARGASGLRLDELRFDISGLPELQTYSTRDGTELEVREYPSAAGRVLVLIHGSGWHSQYLLPLASSLAEANVARVFTPDLRGHGGHPARRGDVDSVHQLVDDLADLIAILRERFPRAPIVVGGHSSGGGLAVRFAGSRHGALADGYLLLSPFLKYNAPTMRPNSGGWAIPYVGRIIGLTLLNNVGIRWFDHFPVIAFDLPEAYRDGTETLVYSHRLNTAYAPRDYARDLGAITQPLLVVAGRADEAFVADQFEPTVTRYTRARVELLPGVTHLGVAVGPEVRPVVAGWLRSTFANEPSGTALWGATS